MVAHKHSYILHLRTPCINVENDVEVQGQQRTHTVHIRDEDERRAMNDFRRLRLETIHFLESLCSCRRSRIYNRQEKERKDGIREGVVQNDNGDDEIVDLQTTKPRQFRVQKMRMRRGTWRTQFFSLVTCCCTDLIQNDADAEIGVGPQQYLANAVHWIFRVSVIPLFVSMCVIYYSASIFFAGMILAAGQLDPACIRVGSGKFEDYGSEFFNAFALSWTTFATTGYGATYPSVDNQSKSPSHCWFVTFVCSLELFLGVLYIGFCAAILFGKVRRFHSHAQVQFSDPIVVQYGPGRKRDGNPDRLHKEDHGSIRSPTESESDSSSSATSREAKSEISPPVLEFRIVNRLFGEEGGEIIDAKLNVVASIDADDVDPLERNVLGPGIRLKRSGSFLLQSFNSRTRESSWGSFRTGSDSSRMFTSASDHPPPSSPPSYRRNSLMPSLKGNFFDPFASFHHPSSRSGNFSLGIFEENQETVEENPTDRLVGKRIFVKINIEASSHPMFNRVWVARHILDETSPVVKASVRRQIRRLGGYWPAKLNSHLGVRESLLFNQILVSLTGVASISATTVYAQKIYDFVDVSVGYRFVNMHFKDSEGSVQVDKDLINDVIEQNGGGGEPLILGF